MMGILWQILIVSYELAVQLSNLTDMIYLTIAIFIWFSKQPSQLNEMVGGNHRVRWFCDGLLVPEPSRSMVFDGCPPSVKRCDAIVPSLQSIPPYAHVKYILLIINCGGGVVHPSQLYGNLTHN